MEVRAFLRLLGHPERTPPRVVVKSKGPMVTGTIKTITAQGYGYITPNDGGPDIIVHRTALVDVTMDQLRPGERVTYVARGESLSVGPRASNVRRAAIE